MDASGDETLSKIALTLYVLHLWCFALHLVKEPYSTLVMVKGTISKSEVKEIDAARQCPYNDSVVDHDEGQCVREGTSASARTLEQGSSLCKQFMDDFFARIQEV